MHDCSIHIASVDDADRIAELIWGVASRFILHEFSPEGTAHFLADHTPGRIRQRIASNFCFHVAEAQGQMAGVVGVRDGSHLFTLFVAEDCQGQGLGRRLWELAKAECLAAGNPGAFTVNSSKYAVPVYERFGFVVAGPVQERNGVQFVPMKMRLNR